MNELLIAHILQRQREAVQRGLLNIWTIYDHPLDFPDSFVARRFETGGDSRKPFATGECIKGHLEDLRDVFFHAGLTCLTRSVEDEPQIVESWL